MAWLTDLLNAQPFLALFLAIGLGYAVGNIQVAGFSLGVGAVLFVGLLIGVIGPKSAPPAFVGLFGLVLFLYGVGIQYGGTSSAASLVLLASRQTCSRLSLSWPAWVPPC